MTLFNRENSFSIAPFLEVDMHSHILPGIDDGAKDIAHSIRLIDGMLSLGYKKLIATPHIMSDLYPNTKESIENAYQRLKMVLDEKGYTIPIHYAAEYLIDEAFPEKAEAGLLCLGQRYVLIETMFSTLPPNIEEILFLLRSLHYTPVLAHPERYHYVEDDLKQLDVFLKYDCKLQSNILSIAGYYGPREKKIALKMIEVGLVDFLGTDMHHGRHLSAIKHLKVKKKTAAKLEALSYENLKLKADF